MFLRTAWLVTRDLTLQDGSLTSLSANIANPTNQDTPERNDLPESHEMCPGLHTAVSQRGEV